jgi:hypothetical protein
MSRERQAVFAALLLALAFPAHAHGGELVKAFQIIPAVVILFPYLCWWVFSDATRHEKAVRSVAVVGSSLALFVANYGCVWWFPACPFGDMSFWLLILAQLVLPGALWAYLAWRARRSGRASPSASSRMDG